MEENKENLPVREEPVRDDKVEGLKVKVKPKPKKLTNSTKETPKINLNKEKDAISESSTMHVDADKQTTNVQEVESGTPESGLQPVTEAKKEEKKQEETGTNTSQVVEEITNDTPVTPTPDPIPVDQPTMPEGVDKLVKFMKETGGDVNDYVRLNADYSGVDDVTLLKEYYKNTKPHLETEEIEFLLDDKFAYDADYDEDKDIRKKKLAIKEEVVKAHAHLNDLKSKYYEEIKLRPGITQDQQKATDFFNRYNDEQKRATAQHESFVKDTKKHFSGDFKGFEFNLGEKRFRYNVTNPDDVANQQSDIKDFVKTFLNKDGTVNDYSGYHKAIYAARNADAIANHFYEQGKADAIKNVVSNTKNINNSARSSQPADHVYLNGLRIKAVTGANSSKLKINTRNKT